MTCAEPLKLLFEGWTQSWGCGATCPPATRALLWPPLDSGAQLSVPTRLEAPPGQPRGALRADRGRSCRVLSLGREWSLQTRVFKMKAIQAGALGGPRDAGCLSLCHPPSGAAEAASLTPLGSQLPAGEAWEMGKVVRLVSEAGLGIHAGWQAWGGGAAEPHLRLGRPPRKTRL